MIIRNRSNGGRTLIRIGMSSLLLAIIVPRLIPTSAGDGAIDAIRGLLYGIAIAANLRGAQLSCAQRCSNSA